MKDHYKILNIDFDASETDIKRGFRKLATIHHPDKNGGSKSSEETFKVILEAYETLSDCNKRAIYDLSYKQYFHQSKSETTNKYETNTEKEGPPKSKPRGREYQWPERTKSSVNYSFWLILALIVLLYFFNTNNKTTTGNPKADQQLEDQESENRPQSGEIEFN